MKKTIYNILVGLILIATNLSALAQSDTEMMLYGAEAGDSIYTVSASVRELPEGYMSADNATAERITNNILSEYSDWETVELDGKLRMEGLPLTPNVKIYMERDKSVSISLRAPFVGEVGRLEANQDSVSVINKMNRTYSTYAVADSPVPVDVSTLQCLLLQRINIPGRGQLGEDTVSLLDMYMTEDFQQFLMLPKREVEIEGCSYGFVTDGEGKLVAIIVTIDSAEDDSVTVEYTPDGSGTDIDVLAAIGERIYRAQLDLKAPKWNVEGFASIVPGPKYRRLPFKEFLKAF